MQLFREVRNKYTQAVRNVHPVVQTQQFWDTVKSMENKTSCPLRLGNTVTTDKSTIIEINNKLFSMAGHAFQLATPTPVNCPAPSTATR
jgi:hypothetical protein